LPSRAYAQADQSGNFTPPLALYQGAEIGNVSLPMRNVRLSIPVLQLKGRGMDLDITATFNTPTWSTNEIDDPSGMQIFDTDFAAGGWSIGVNRMGIADGWTAKCTSVDAQGICQANVLYATFTGSDGSRLQFGQQGPQNTTPTRFWSSDGTYTSIPNVIYIPGQYISTPIFPKVVYKDGVALNQHYNSMNWVDYSTLEDTNGNLITCTWQWANMTFPATCTDTVGRAITFTYVPNTYNLNTISYLDSSGTQQTIRFTWSSQIVNIPWADSSQNNDPNCNNGWACYGLHTTDSILLLQAITLPNNRSYSFEYLTNADGSTTGQISKVTLPTGGYIRYQYPCSNGCAYPFVGQSPGQEPWAPATAKIVSVDGTQASEQTWNYGNPSSNAFSVTDPLGNSQVSYFTWNLNCPPAPNQIDFKKPNGTIIKQVFNTIAADSSSYNDPYPGPFIGPYCNNPRVTQSKTVLSDTNQQSLTTSTYGSFGNVTDQYDYDWGSGNYGALLRHINKSYLHDSNSAVYGDLAAHILDRVNGVNIYDGSNALLSQATTGYDSPGPAGTTNIVQHDYANFSAQNHARGNPTQIQKWLNTTGGWVLTTNAYNDAGNLTQTTDPNNNITSFGYADQYTTPAAQPTSAFVTQITRPTTNGVPHTERSQYYLNTGLVAAHCGDNFPAGTTCATGLSGMADYETFTYDWNGRITGINSGNGAQTGVTYNEAALPINIRASTALDSTHNVVQNYIYDGSGRISQSQLLSDPSGTSSQLTTYDALGRKARIYNPTRCLSPNTNCGESTWGYVAYDYDALGRSKTLTGQDNGVVTTSYKGNCTLVTDQAGKQRNSCTDALGRLTEVDEPGSQPPTQSNHATMQTDGNFVLYNSGNTALWSTSTAGTNAGPIYMQDDGNLVLYIVKWLAGTYATPSPGPFPVQGCSIGSYLVTNERINANQCIVSPHGQYMLYMASDGNFFIYDLAHNVGTWGPGTYGHPGAYAIMQGDGNLCVYDANNLYLWCSGTNGTYAERLNMEDDGRIIIYKSAWSSGTSTGQFNWTALPHPSCDVGIGTGWTGVLGTGSCFVSPNGHFDLLLQADGNMVIYDLSTTPATALWSTSTGITPLSSGYALVTKYQYDGLGNLICAEQHGSVSGTGCPTPSTDPTVPPAVPNPNTWRVRTFTYDSLSRLITSTNPETGTICYGFWSAGHCVSGYDGIGNLMYKTAPAPNQTGTATQTVSYCYDALSRMTGKAYSQQSCPLTTPVATYFYDQTSFNGITITNGRGRRTGMTDQAGAEAWSYDAIGGVLTDRRTSSGITKTTSYAYNLLGHPTSITYPSGSIINYGYSNAALATSLTDVTHSVTYASAATFSPSGSLSSITNGTNLNSVIFYNSRLQPCRIFVSTNTGIPLNCTDMSSLGSALDMSYSFNLSSGDNGNVVAITNNRDTARSQAFAYDALNRLSSAQTTSTSGSKCFGESFGYDAWGNLLTISGLSGYSGCTQENLATTATAKNQVSGSAYDAAGNLTTGGYGYDAENHLTNAGAVTYTYDGDGKRVAKSSGKLYWYGLGTEVLDETDTTGSNTSSGFSEYVFLGSRRVARRDSTGAIFYYFSDQIGTSRIIVQSGQTTPCYDADFYPFGGEKSPIVNTCPQDYKFAGKRRDSESGLDYFGARYYSSSVGRFIVPDWSQTPSPVPYANFADPQSLHLYSYAHNNPVTLTDPDGHSICPPDCDPTLPIVMFLAAHPQLSFSLAHPRIASDLRYNKGAWRDPSKTNLTTNTIRITLGLGLERTNADLGTETNAMRHALWSAAMTSKYGTQVATEAANSHEANPNVDLSVRTFTGKDAAGQADQTADLLNNQIGRAIGEANPGASMTQLAGAALDYYHTTGLYVIQQNADGSLSVVQQKLSDDEYKNAKDKLAEMDPNGVKNDHKDTEAQHSNP
jgi:RHS repeat-associated protein